MLTNRQIAILLGLVIFVAIAWFLPFQPPPNTSVDCYGSITQPNQGSQGNQTVTPSPPASVNGVEPGPPQDACEQTDGDKGVNRQIARFTKWLAVATCVLAFAAFWQAWITRSTARRQLRAYVFLETVAIIDGSQLKVKPLVDRTDQVGAGFILKNSGQTPAYNLLHWAAIDIKNVQEEATLAVPQTLHNESAAYAGPGGSLNKFLWLNRKMTADEIAGIRDWTKAIFVYGKITYRDAFRQNWSVTYRLKYSGYYPPEEGATFSFCDGGNDAD